MKLIKEQLKWLDRIIYFDSNDFLREKANDHYLLQEIISELEKKLNTTNDLEDIYFLTGTLGNLFRVKEEPVEAIRYLKRSYKIAKDKKDTVKEVVSVIRLGEAYKYANHHDEALQLFNSALQKCYEYEPSYLDFAFQHKGKCLMEMERLSEAMEAFQGAMAIRKVKGDQKLIQSTEDAMAYLKNLLQ